MSPVKKLAFILLGIVSLTSVSALASSLSSLLLLSIAPQLPRAAAKEKTHYEILGLKQDATLQDIKKAYRKLAVQHHPDRNLGNEEEATVKFREISEAYEILSDDQNRKQYDKMLKYGGAGGPGGGGHTFNWSTGGGARRRHEFKHRDPCKTYIPSMYSAFFAQLPSTYLLLFDTSPSSNQLLNSMTFLRTILSLQRLANPWTTCLIVTFLLLRTRLVKRPRNLEDGGIH